jgi:hypothetical protein
MAERITFGIELETTVPRSSCVVVGPYHCGIPVESGQHAATGEMLTAPDFQGSKWRAERDGSIECGSGHMPCEFVSPVLSGSGEVAHLVEFVAWANAIGAKVNASCGCHITVGVKSIIGTDDPQAMSEFARKLAHIARWHAMSLYGQTGAGRHLNHYRMATTADGATGARPSAGCPPTASRTARCPTRASPPRSLTCAVLRRSNGSPATGCSSSATSPSFGDVVGVRFILF